MLGEVRDTVRDSSTILTRRRWNLGNAEFGISGIDFTSSFDMRLIMFRRRARFLDVPRW